MLSSGTNNNGVCNMIRTRLSFHSFHFGIGESGVMPDNAVLANRGTLVIFHYPVAIAT